MTFKESNLGSKTPRLHRNYVLEVYNNIGTTVVVRSMIYIDSEIGRNLFSVSSIPLLIKMNAFSSRPISANRLTEHSGKISYGTQTL